VRDTVSRTTPTTIAYDREPEQVEFTDQIQLDSASTRVCGPFEVMSLGRYSLEDWKGYLVGADGGAPEKLENYVEVICRLYRPDVEIGTTGGFLHGISRTPTEEFGISVGPLTGRVTARQVLDAASEAAEHDLKEVHLLGWAFEANVGEQKAAVERDGTVEVRLIMIRPDALAEGLKVTQPEMLFSPLALPEIRLDLAGDGSVTVTLDGVGLFNRKTRMTAYHSAGDGYIAAWYLDQDYDGDCFVDCQMFFDFKKAPNLRAAAGIDVEADEFDLVFTSEPFEPGEYNRVAVKVVDVYGNESTVVRDL
jgi:adenine-specific DNA-methyltransferase